MSAGRNSARAATAAGGAVLLGSLFLPWSHQLPAGLPVAIRGPVTTVGLPADPTAWQVYAAADAVLAALAVALVALAAFCSPGRPSRGAAFTGAGAVVLAAGFVAHAVAVAPTNGLVFATTVGGTLRYARIGASAGVGETVALVGLGIAVMGLLLGFQHRAERPEPHPAAGLLRP